MSPDSGAATATPLVSTIMPVYNPGPHLADTLNSLINQTWTDWEAVVVDDGSTEDLRWVSDLDPRVRFLRQDNQGVSAARNSGIRAARGTLLAFLDQDDIWFPDKLRLQVEWMTRHPSVVLTSTGFERMDEHGAYVGEGYVGHSGSYDALLQGCGICASTVLARRDAILSAGLFRHLRISQDWDLWLRLAAHRPITHLPVVLARYREHPDQGSSDFRQLYRDARVVLAEHRHHPLSRVGLARVRHLSGAQALDAARAAWSRGDVKACLRDLSYALLRAPSLALPALLSRSRRAVGRPGPRGHAQRPHVTDVRTH